MSSGFKCPIRSRKQNARRFDKNEPIPGFGGTGTSEEEYQKSPMKKTEAPKTKPCTFMERTDKGLKPCTGTMTNTGQYWQCGSNSSHRSRL